MKNIESISAIAGISIEANSIERAIQINMCNWYSESITLQREKEEKLKMLFNKLKDDFSIETMFFSNPSDIFSNSHYLKLVSLGSSALPLIMEDWEHSELPWFYALSQITGENPIKDESAGDVRLMKKDWKEWFNQNQIVNVYKPEYSY